MKVGIISDTHNILREEVLQRLNECEYILHAGDFCKYEILEQLEEIAPVYGVRGNNDKESWAERLPINLVIEINDCKIGMAHEKKDLPQNKGDIDLMIYGHSHQYDVYTQENVQYINPGSCGRKRFSLPLSFIIAEIKKDEIVLEKIDL
nr:metallophosphoesterase family protein [uncultured Cellulosilyticum sp.]